MKPWVVASETDVFVFLKSLQGAAVSMALSDLPYPTKERFRRTGTTTRLTMSKDSSNPWFGVLGIEKLCDALRALYDVMAKDSYAFIYVDDDTALLLAARLGVPAALEKLIPSASSRAPVDKIGFGWWTPSTWCKTSPVDPRRPHGGSGYHGVASTERILCLEKGRRRLGRFVNAFCMPRLRGKYPWAKVSAATPKPISIARELIRCATEPGAVVVDPFIGSGTHAIAAATEGRCAVVNDVDLGVCRDWIGAYKRGDAKELIQQTDGIVVDFDMKGAF